MFVINTIIALVIFLTSALMSLTNGIDITLGNYLWLPMGAKILAFLLFGLWALGITGCFTRVTDEWVHFV